MVTSGAMMRVLVIVNNLEQASYRLRIAALAPVMRERGIEWDIQVRPRRWRARRRLMRMGMGESIRQPAANCRCRFPLGRGGRSTRFRWVFFGGLL